MTPPIPGTARALVLLIASVLLGSSCADIQLDNPNDPYSKAWKWEYAAAPTLSSVVNSSQMPLSIELHTTETAPDTVIRYTLDGSDPDEQSNTYREPIQIKTTTTLSARTFSAGKLPSAVTRHTYTISPTETQIRSPRV